MGIPNRFPPRQRQPPLLLKISGDVMRHKVSVTVFLILQLIGISSATAQGSLIGEIQDLRLQIVSAEIAKKTDEGGGVYVFFAGFFPGEPGVGHRKEGLYDLIEGEDVAAFLSRTLGVSLEGKRQPQLRVVSRNRLVQSPWRGFDEAFLALKLNPGDILVVSRIQ